MPLSWREFYFNYEPQDEIHAADEYPYMIMLRRMISVICSWPHRPLDPRDTKAIEKRKRSVLFQKCFLFVACNGAGICNITYILNHKKTMTFFELGHMYISLLMTVVSVSRMVTLCFSDEYTAIGRKFLDKFHLLYYKDRSEYFMQTHKRVHRISHIFTLYLIGQMIGGLFLFNVTPMYNNYSNGFYSSGGLTGNDTYDHALYYAYPINVSTDLRGYIIANIVNWYLSYICSAWFCMYDLFLSLMVFQIWGHFKILLYNLDNFPRPSAKTSFMLENSNETLTYEMYSTTEQQRVGVQLNEIIDHHREIINFTNELSDVFGPMLAVYYAFHQASGCLLLLECSQMTAAALARYLPLTVILFQQLMQLSIIFELIGSISDRLKFSVYGLPWECMDTKNRRTVAFFLMNVQESVHVKALGLADVGVTSMTTILKTSMSYFTFLNSM